MGFTNWQERAEKAEAELVRLAKQEPVVRIDSGYTGGCVTGYLRKGVDANTVVGKQLYAAPVHAVAAPAVLDVHKIEDQLQLAEIEMLNAKAWSAGTQAKRHIDFAMTAICCTRALLQPAHVTDSVAAKQSQIDSLAMLEEWCDKLLAEFPLLDDEGLCQEKHHCEWTLQQDRKRLHALLQSTPQSSSEPVAHHPV